MRGRFAGLFWIALLAGPAGATTVLRLERDELASRATRVFEGTVLEVEGTRDAEGRIVTRVRFAIERDGWWKGAGSAQAELLFPGGRIESEGRALIVAGMPSFARGEHVLVFASEAASGGTALAMPVGLKQGKLRVVVTPEGRRILERDVSGLELLDPRTREITAAPQALQRFDYEEWRAAVRRIAQGR